MLSIPKPMIDNELQEAVHKAIDQWFKKKGIEDPRQIELILNSMPKEMFIDETYCAIWSIRDFDTIVKKLISNVNTGRLMSYDYFNYLRRIYNDQSVVLDRYTELEPLGIGRKWDRMTFEGVRACFLNLIGQQQAAFQFAAEGDGTLPANSNTYGMQALVNERARAQISPTNNGFMDLRGETLFITATFPSTTPSHTIKEVIILDSSDPLDDRAAFYVSLTGADQKGHVSGNDVPTISTSCNVCTL